jgi:hypothetical protein
MTNDDFMGRFSSLPPEGQRRVIDFMELLRQFYQEPQPGACDTQEESADEAFSGMWVDHDELADSSHWVRSVREREWVKPIE